MYQSYEQALTFIRNDKDCVKSIGVACSVFLTHKKDFNEKKALEYCHQVAIKLARIYNKKVTKFESYSRAFTPSVIDRLKYFVYDTAITTVKNCQENCQ